METSNNYQIETPCVYSSTILFNFSPVAFSMLGVNMEKMDRWIGPELHSTCTGYVYYIYSDLLLNCKVGIKFIFFVTYMLKYCGKSQKLNRQDEFISQLCYLIAMDSCDDN